MVKPIVWPDIDRFNGAFCRRERLRHMIPIERLSQKAQVGHHGLVLFEGRRGPDRSLAWRLAVYAALRALVAQACHRTISALEDPRFGDPEVVLARTLSMARERADEAGDGDPAFLRPDF